MLIVSLNTQDNDEGTPEKQDPNRRARCPTRDPNLGPSCF